MNRRGFLSGIPAIAAVTVAPMAAAMGETAVSVAFNKWVRYREAVEQAPTEMPEELFIAMCDRKAQLSRILMDTPSVDLRDVAMKVYAFTDCGRDFDDDGKGTGGQIMKELGNFAGISA